MHFVPSQMPRSTLLAVEGSGQLRLLACCENMQDRMPTAFLRSRVPENMPDRMSPDRMPTFLLNSVPEFNGCQIQCHRMLEQIPDGMPSICQIGCPHIFPLFCNIDIFLVMLEQYTVYIYIYMLYSHPLSAAYNSRGSLEINKGTTYAEVGR